MVKFLGRGAFAKVFLVRRVGRPRLYAMKVVSKNVIKNPSSMATEKSIMLKSNHPFIVKLRFSFQDNNYAAFVMDYMPGGTLSRHLSRQKNKHFSVDVVRFYAAQVLLALEYLHNTLKAVYRDLKPQNILVDENGNLKISDFGLCKSSLKSRKEEL